MYFFAIDQTSDQGSLRDSVFFLTGKGDAQTVALVPQRGVGILLRKPGVNHLKCFLRY